MSRPPTIPAEKKIRVVLAVQSADGVERASFAGEREDIGPGGAGVFLPHGDACAVQCCT